MRESHKTCCRAWLWGWHLALCGVAGLVWLCAASVGGELVRFEATSPQMGVPFKIILYARDEASANGAFAAAFARIGELDAILSDYDPASELSRLSRTSGTNAAVPIGEDLWHVLERSQELAERTEGAFDVTVGPYVRLWRRARRNGQMPSDERMAEARAAVSYKLLQLDAEHRTARLLPKNMRLDLGGIAMGYAVDEALAVLKSRSITRALVDASGDIGASDPPPGKDGWTIGVAPLSAEGTPSREILLAGAAVTTSGDAFQHVVIGGRRYSHIVDPRTGLGLTDQSGVTVIAADCMTADSLATAVSVLGPEAGLKLVDETPGAAALIVRVEHGKPATYESKRFREFVTDEN